MEKEKDYQVTVAQEKIKKDAEVECDVCGKEHPTEECPELGLGNSKFIPQISRARLTVPHFLNPVEFPDGGVGILALETIANKTQLGPFEAKKTMHDIDRDDLFVLKILSKDGSFISLDASSEAHCNWMALVQVARNEEEQNCMAYQLGINIFFNTTRDINIGDELKVWYAPQYAKKLKKSLVPDGTTKSMLGEILFTDPDEDEEEGTDGEGSKDGDSSRDSAEIHPDDVEGDYTCKHCEEKFTSQFLFAKHIRDHLFPVYNYSEGPPRRGRRPVPLKIGEYRNYSLPRNRGRGRGRGRGRPRGSGGARILRGGTGRRPGRPRRSSLMATESENEEENGMKKQVEDEQNENKIEIPDEMKNVKSDCVKDLASVESEQTEVKTPVQLVPEENKPTEKRRRGRPRKIHVETPEEAPIAISPKKSPELSILDTPVLDGERPRRSARAFRGLGKLGKWLKYPGEDSSEDEAVGSSEEEGVKLPRKRFGVAMAATLRKAALDEITSPVSKRRSQTNIAEPKARTPASSNSASNIKKNDSPVTPKAKVAVEKSVADKAKEVDNVEVKESTEKPSVESPKKFFVITKSSYEITAEPEQSLVNSDSQPVESVGELTVNGEESKEETVAEVEEVANVDESIDIKENIELINRNENGLNKESDIELGTMEEVVGVPQHERKNTIADLDGTDALTALVNAAISADKVPDPIAMVAADLYEDRSMEDDGDSDEYKANIKRSNRPGLYVHGVDTAEDDSENERPHQPLRQRRKKRRRGDDPELEELESKTKIVEGPNGTEEFACGICNKHFTQLKYLKLHLPAHTDRYRCNICGKRFARNESLLKHTCDDTANLVEQTVDEEGNDTFCCKECGRSFNQIHFAIRHASMHRARFTCEKCGRVFLRQDLLDEHDCSGGQLEEGEVSHDANHECQICKQSFTSGKYLFRHMAMHTDIYKCEVCGKCYSRKDSLQRHISRCCPELSGEYSVHVCPNCKKTFGTQLGLQNHTLNCGKYQCGACKVAYFSLKDLAEHECAGKVLNEKASVQFPCKECNKTFASIAYLVRHEASHHGAFKCDLCDRIFIRKEELNWHTPVCTTRQKIQQEGSAPCETCGEVFSEWLAFKEHHMTHTHPHRCDKCGKRFIKIGTLHNHKCEAIGETGADQTNLLACEICQKTFKNERYLSRHLSLHGQPEFACEFCGKLFTRKDYLNDHQCRLPNGTTVRMVRKKNRLFIKDNLACPDCGKSFSSRSNMMKHLKVHGEKQAECHICRKKFHYENYLKLHIATVHEKQYQLQCTHCGKVLFSKTGLIAHIKQFHADTIKLYPCPKCGKTFRQKGNMKTHLISHTKERAYKCDVCGKAFKYPDQLNRHRLEHTLQQKYSCELCDKQFVRTYELRNHMRNYHSGYVYVCGVCHECCAHRHTIIRHYKRKHPEVGNVFEEKPEFIDSLQKPVTAATQARMMIENDDIKPSIVRVGLPRSHEIIVTTDEDGNRTYSGGEVILQQGVSGEMVSNGEQGIHIEGPGGESTVFILKVVNQDENGAIQEMELTEDTKAHLAQLLQAHGAGQDTITHIQVGDQTLQIQREEDDGSTMLDDELEQMEGVQDIKFDPQQLAQLTHPGEAVVSKLTASGLVDGSSQLTALHAVQAGGVVGMEGVQVVEMEGGRLGQIIHMDEEMGSGVGIQMESGQVIHLDQSQLLEMEEGGRVVVSGDFGSHHMTGLPELKVTKRRGTNGEIVVEVEGQDGQMVDLSQALPHANGEGLEVEGQDEMEIEQEGEVRMEPDLGIDQGQTEG
ncbi:uncharacterized protein LOC131952446 [Physella acuta]|uniref:uncharacterized protein LOC131952446 n=1 Tax=Physella acuta TaxID=109671 RepID=UPI0027DB82F6|nr:uncharacterized protein LOC131952446 [Physella acuta]XP_059171074.1 uncharacterized protein LOC131952446 [Physella acuta]XP_059171075.1 uncharacterized protein LOC131952446 [Physella acuta]